jgi:hypothetical protein
MTADYKQLAKELYDALKRVRCFSITDSEMDTILQKYEEATTRGTGRTTALYLKSITEALENPGKSVEFIDHYPHNWNRARLHEDSLRNIIDRLHYDIIVQAKGQAQVYLYNRFGL